MGRIAACGLVSAGARLATRYQYDAAGNRTGVTDHLGRETAYAYDTLNRRAQVTIPDPDGAAGPLAAPFTLYVYNNAGDPTAATATSATNSFSRVTSYNYDEDEEATERFARPFREAERKKRGFSAKFAERDEERAWG